MLTSTFDDNLPPVRAESADTLHGDVATFRRLQGQRTDSSPGRPSWVAPAAAVALLGGVAIAALVMTTPDRKADTLETTEVASVSQTQQSALIPAATPAELTSPSETTTVAAAEPVARPADLILRAPVARRAAPTRAAGPDAEALTSAPELSAPLTGAAEAPANAPAAAEPIIPAPAAATEPQAMQPVSPETPLAPPTPALPRESASEAPAEPGAVN